MKSIKQSNSDSITYPILMENIHTGIVVLFTSRNEGTLVHAHDNLDSLGAHHTRWSKADESTAWKPLQETLELSN